MESVSGFSGTGATVILDVETIPHSVQLWRSLSNWVGGLGIIVIFMAILPQAGKGAVYMFRAESTGPTKDRQMPRIRDNAKALFTVYVAFTLVCSIAYYLCGLTPFVAVNHAMTTIATGGYSVYNGTVAEYGNIWLEFVMSFFMVISSGSFAMYVMASRHGITTLFRNTEFRVFLWLIAIASILIAADLMVEMRIDMITAITRAMVGDPILEPIEQKPYNGHWAEIILHADKDGVFDHLEISKELPAEIVEEDLWVVKGDKVEGFEGANNAIGTLVLKFQTAEELEKAITNQRSWLKVVVK